MIDFFNGHLAFLIFESIFCLLSALVYAVSEDPIRIRKNAVLAINLACGFMLISEYLFYVYEGSTAPLDHAIMVLVNAAVYYLILLLLLFYTVLMSIRLFNRFDLRSDMPCRKRLFVVFAIIAVGLILVTISQFTGIYYYFDDNGIYHRGTLHLVSVLLPTLGALVDASIILQHRTKINRIQRLVLLSYIVFPMIGEILQLIFFGYSLLNICIGLSVFLIFIENIVNKEKEIVRASKTEIRTGLANEHGCIEWLNSMKGKPELTGYAAVFFDLRRFSEINRKYGIENGNRVLASFGNVMLDKIEEDEILGRQFGNNFIAIVRKEHLDSLLECLNGVLIFFTNAETGKEEQVTLSAHIGVYRIDKTDLDGEDILILASLALGEAKSKVGNDVVWLTQDLIDSIAKRKKLESEISAGLAEGEFLPYYQPKVNAQTGEICGAEALSRWIHNGSIVSPGIFIPVMEENDTICLLDFCVLKEVCKDIATWRSEGIRVPTISFNCSRRNLVDPSLADRIDSIVTEAGIPKDLIEIEITESVDEFSIDVLSCFVGSLHRLGYKVSIDDFGNASSSLALLRQITFDTLKIDKGFVDLVNERDFIILSNIIRMAGEIDVDVVAEGVEQRSQIDILGSLGVDVIQGYYFDKPLPKEVMTERLKAQKYPV